MTVVNYKNLLLHLSIEGGRCSPLLEGKRAVLSNVLQDDMEHSFGRLLIWWLLCYMKEFFSFENDPIDLAALSVSGFSNLQKSLQCVVGMKLVMVIY